MFSFLDSCLEVVNLRFRYVVLRLYLEENRYEKPLEITANSWRRLLETFLRIPLY